jgi:hypothetical protein
VINFLLDTAIFLARIVGFIKENYDFSIDGEAMDPFLEGSIIPLFMFRANAFNFLHI